jgi:hypothetical protein
MVKVEKKSIATNISIRREYYRGGGNNTFLSNLVVFKFLDAHIIFITLCIYNFPTNIFIKKRSQSCTLETVSLS